MFVEYVPDSFPLEITHCLCNSVWVVQNKFRSTGCVWKKMRKEIRCVLSEVTLNDSVVWLEACLWLVIIIKTVIEGNKCVKANCADSHTKLLRFWNHTKFQLCKKVRAQTMLRAYSFVTGSLQTCVRKGGRIWHTYVKNCHYEPQDYTHNYTNSNLLFSKYF